jgi:hypothetical protein
LYCRISKFHARHENKIVNKYSSWFRDAVSLFLVPSWEIKNCLPRNFPTGLQANSPWPVPIPI